MKAAIRKSKEVTSLEWILPLLNNAEQYFDNVSTIEEVDGNSFPRVADYTSIKRNDYEKALLFAKYILLDTILRWKVGSVFPRIYVGYERGI